MSNMLKEKMQKKAKLASSQNQLSIRANGIIKYLDKHITDEITLDSLSKQFGISISYLSHLFKSYTGLSVFHYIKLKRLELVKSYYNSGKTLTEAALNAGFSNYIAYYKAYRSEFGESPTKQFTE